MCVFQSPSTSSNHPEHPHVDSQEQVLSAVRRSGDCRLGDHYKGHKRAIYRTASEWSQHGSPTLQHCNVLGHQRKAQNRESEASGEFDDLNMKVRDVAALVASALWLVSLREIMRLLIFDVGQMAVHFKELKPGWCCNSCNI